MFNKWFVQIMSKLNQKRFEKLLDLIACHLSDDRSDTIKEIKVIKSTDKSYGDPFSPYEIVVTYYQSDHTDTYTVTYDVISKNEAEELINEVKKVLEAKEKATRRSIDLINNGQLFAEDKKESTIDDKNNERLIDNENNETIVEPIKPIEHISEN